MSDLSNWGGGAPDPNPGAEPAGVDPDAEPDAEPIEAAPAGPDVGRDDDATECWDCGSPSVAYERASSVFAALPSKPLCRSCILDRA